MSSFKILVDINHCNFASIFISNGTTVSQSIQFWGGWLEMSLFHVNMTWYDPHTMPHSETEGKLNTVVQRCVACHTAFGHILTMNVNECLNTLSLPPSSFLGTVKLRTDAPEWDSSAFPKLIFAYFYCFMLFLC